MADVIPRIVSREQALRIAGQDPAGLLKIPAFMLEEEMFLLAVRNDGLRLGYVPQRGRNRVVCEAAVNETGMALKYVPRKMLDRDICNRAVHRTGTALRYVPPAFIDWNMAATAVENDGQALAYVPEALKDQAVCLMAVRNNAPLASVPDRERSRAVWLSALETGRVRLREVPGAYLSREACLTAVRRDGSSLADVPRAMRTEEICRAAVSCCGVALLFVPEELKSRDMCLAAVRSFAWAVRYVPENLKGDRDIAAAAGNREQGAIADAPATGRNDGRQGLPLAKTNGSVEPGPFPQGGRLPYGSRAQVQARPAPCRETGAYSAPRGFMRENRGAASFYERPVPGPGMRNRFSSAPGGTADDNAWQDRQMAQPARPYSSKCCVSGKRAPDNSWLARPVLSSGQPQRQPAELPKAPQHQQVPQQQEAQAEGKEGFAPSFW